MLGLISGCGSFASHRTVSCELEASQSGKIIRETVSQDELTLHLSQVCSVLVDALVFFSTSWMD